MSSFFINMSNYFINIGSYCLLGAAIYGGAYYFYPKKTSCFQKIAMKTLKKSITASLRRTCFILNTYHIDFIKKQNINCKRNKCTSRKKRIKNSYKKKIVDTSGTKLSSTISSQQNNICLEIKETNYTLLAYNNQYNKLVELSNITMNGLKEFLSNEVDAEKPSNPNIDFFNMFLLKKNIEGVNYYKNITSTIKNKKFTKIHNLSDFEYKIIENPLRSTTITMGKNHLDIDNHVANFCIDDNELFDEHFVKWFVTHQLGEHFPEGEKYRVSIVDKNIDIFIIERGQKFTLEEYK